jgi:hypothetical protein
MFAFVLNTVLRIFQIEFYQKIVKSDGFASKSCVSSDSDSGNRFIWWEIGVFIVALSLINVSRIFRKQKHENEALPE